MKKGFTLVEIIISITLLLLMGTGVTFFFVNKNLDKNLENTTNKILEAANLYVRTEVDDNGELYLNRVMNSAKGVKITLTNLVEKGYIDKSLKDDINDNIGTPANNEDYYVMFLKGEGEKNKYCDDGSTIILASWTIAKDKDIFLCDNLKSNVNILDLHKNTKMKVSLNKFAVSKEFYDSVADANKDSYLTYQENGPFTYYNESTKVIYTYYRGAVDNNYVKLGQDSEGNDLYWRILWVSDNNKMKLVLDNEVPLYIPNKYGQPLLMTSNDNVITNFHSYKAPFDFSFFKYNEEEQESSKIFSVNDADFLNAFIDLGKSNVYNTFYNTANIKWYNTTDLKSYEYLIKTNNFCYSDCYEDNGLTERYLQSNNFECVRGMDDDTPICKYTGNNVSSPVGFLTYGDVVRSGLSGKTSLNLLNSGNFLINSKSSFITSDKSYANLYGTDTEYSYYYYSINGIDSSYTTDEIWGTGYKYTLKNIDTNSTLIDKYRSGSSSSAYRNFIMKKSIFIGTALKPVIVIDTTNIKLSDALGTKESPYEIIVK